MPDLDSQIRHAMEALIQQRLDAEASRRGWDLAGDALAMAQAMAGGQSASGPPGTTDTALTFATGYDGTLTVTPFTFDFSALDGTDQLV